MASKKKVSLNDYDLTTTLGTGNLSFDIAFQVLSVESDWQETRRLGSTSQ